MVTQASGEWCPSAGDMSTLENACRRRMTYRSFLCHFACGPPRLHGSSRQHFSMFWLPNTNEIPASAGIATSQCLDKSSAFPSWLLVSFDSEERSVSPSRKSRIGTGCTYLHGPAPSIISVEQHGPNGSTVSCEWIRYAIRLRFAHCAMRVSLASLEDLPRITIGLEIF